MKEKQTQIVDFTEISPDGEQWEFFGRDFLTELGFTIEADPNRGPDGGKDILVVEHLRGNLNSYPFRWLVSAKHFANSNRSVSEADEINIRERLEAFRADGFIGFYSTIASSGLSERLRLLRDERKIHDYRIFDHRLIENYLVRVGYSRLMMRYMPLSYARVKPRHLICDRYLPLNCAVTGDDLLEILYQKKYSANLIFINKDDGSERWRTVVGVYWVLKEKNETLMQRVRPSGSGLLDSWDDLGDLVMPPRFLQWVFSIMNRIRSGDIVFEDSAYERLTYFISAVAQIVLRESTEEEYRRLGDLLKIPEWA